MQRQEKSKDGLKKKLFGGVVFPLIPEPNLRRVISANTAPSSPGADALATGRPPAHATRTDTSSPTIVTSGPAPATSWT